MFHIHPEKKAKAEMLGANARFTEGTRIVTLYSKDDEEIPYISISNRILQDTDTFPLKRYSEISNYINAI